MSNLNKKFMGLSVALTVFLCVGCNGQSEINSKILLTPTSVYKVDGLGDRMDIYEFTPTDNPHITCLILTTRGDSASRIECFAKNSSDT